MAQKVTIVLVDDLDGSEAVETVQFAVDGKSYEIDLSEKNAADLRNAIAPWVGHARRVTGAPARVRRPAAAAGRASNVKEIRDWARANGYEVSDRGRVPAAIQDAYSAAH